MEAYDFLNAYYSNYDEEGRLQSKHGQVEYLTTMRYIQRYLQLGMRVLEVGAGTGRYSHTLARMGHKVDAVELIPHNIEILKSNTLPDENITVRQGNALDLSAIPDACFDITLVLGPMYHLYTVEDQLKALSEALRVTRQGGMLFVAYCISDASIISHGFKDGFAPALIEQGLLDPVTFKAYSTPAELFELYRKEDIDALMEHFPVTRFHYVATDLMTNHMRETVDSMDEDMFELYLRYHFSVCERADMVGITHHSLDVFRKE
jgi:ubiquinone/menaquinone biosynthesis C-methylase UbiE